MPKVNGWQRESDKLAAAIGFVACAKCGEKKRADSFYNDAEDPSQRSKNCKACEGYYKSFGLHRPTTKKGEF